MTTGTPLHIPTVMATQNRLKDLFTFADYSSISFDSKLGHKIFLDVKPEIIPSVNRVLLTLNVKPEQVEWETSSWDTDNNVVRKEAFVYIPFREDELYKSHR